MDTILKYLKLTGYTILTVIITIFILTVFNYYSIISNNTMNYLKFIIVLLSTFISGLKIGHKTTQKGWLAGLKLGGIFIFVFFIFTYLGLEKNITLKNIVYYLIIMLITMLGSMIGINKKETN